MWRNRTPPYQHLYSASCRHYSIGNAQFHSVGKRIYIIKHLFRYIDLQRLLVLSAADAAFVRYRLQQRSEHNRQLDELQRLCRRRLDRRHVLVRSVSNFAIAIRQQPPVLHFRPGVVVGALVQEIRRARLRFALPVGLLGLLQRHFGGADLVGGV